MDNIDELIRELEQRNRKELRWVSPEDLHISCVDVPDELCRRAAAGIRQLQKENAAKNFMLKRLMESWNKERASSQDDNHQLRQQNAELVEALQNIADGPRDVEKSYISLLHEVRSEARDALAKAKGSE